MINTNNISTPQDYYKEQAILANIVAKYDHYNDMRSSQRTDNRLISYAIYNANIPHINDWNCRIELPEIYELSQTLKSHIIQNMYSHPDGMFDVTGCTYKAQQYANRQKAMLVHTFEEMKIEDEMEKIINSVVETGEVTLFVGWDTKIRKARRALTLEEQIRRNTDNVFVVEEKVVYDNAKVKFINYEDFVFDVNSREDWDSCPKIYRTYQTLDDIKTNTANNLLNLEKLETLKGVVANKDGKNNSKYSIPKIEVLEYWGDLELQSGEILKNQLICIAGRSVIIRFEENPFIINPFIHANIIENPSTGRGISPLRVALILNNISSTILNKQLDALALMMNPPYLAPKGCFKGSQDVSPGKVIEYDSTLMTNSPIPLSFDKAMTGWDFLNYFRSTIESTTGIFKNMAGNIQNAQRTATEIDYSVNGQEARLNMILESINRKIIIPMVEKTAQLISYFKIGKELIKINDHGKSDFVEVDDEVRNSHYCYHYGDRKAIFERKSRIRELFEIISKFLNIPEVSQRINWLECFKFSLEQYGVENSNNFIKEISQNTLNTSLDNQIQNPNMN